MKKTTFKIKELELREYVKRLSLLLKEPAGLQFAIENLKLKIKRLLQDLRGIVSNRRLRRILGTTAVVLGLANGLQAQNFATPLSNPFNLATTSAVDIRFMETADLDNDGDFDILVGTYDPNYGQFEYYQNIGTQTNPDFAAAVINPFGLSRSSSYSATPSLADMDGDGDLDLLVGGYYNELFYYENTGTAVAPNFAAPVTDPFNFTRPAGDSYFSVIDVADLDGDGDFDILSGRYDYDDGFLTYYRNDGTSTNPSFAAPVDAPFNLSTSGQFYIPKIGDIDLDGDLDVLCTSEFGNFQLYVNNGTITNPSFDPVVQNPFGLTGEGDTILHSLVDLDADGDLDILVSEYGGDFLYYQNTDTASIDDSKILGKVFPNPVRDVLYLDFETEIDEIKVYNTLGQLISQPEITNQDTCDLSNLKTGLYLVEVKSGNSRETYRVQKE
ncbi:MAG: T9SS type A sorting domain-containing protein [Nonlabens sp.]